jgi:hypothetical protein
MNDNQLATIAELMDYWTRSENTSLQREANFLSDAISARNRYIAELQEDFNQVIRMADIQRQSLANMAAAIEILQDKLNHYEPDAAHQYLVATDENRIFHAIRVDREHLAATQETEVIDLTTDTELTDTDVE